MSTTARFPAPFRTDVQWPKTSLRVAFGLIWLVDAVLKWLPGFRDSYMDAVMGQSEGQPDWLRPWFEFWTGLEHPYSDILLVIVALAETVIAVSLILGLARKVVYVAAILFSLLIWSTAEGFGGPYTDGSEDVGTAIVYALVFAFLLALNYYQGPSTHSVDHALERRISWWYLLAEVGHGDYYRATFGGGARAERSAVRT